MKRSNTNKKIYGVCGGLAESLNISAKTLRIIFVILGLLDGTGILLYLLLALFMKKGE